MKRIFYLSGTLFFLSLTLLMGVHIGQQTATAEPAQKVVGFTSHTTQSGLTELWVLLSNGDLYAHPTSAIGTTGGYQFNFTLQ